MRKLTFALLLISLAVPGISQEFLTVWAKEATSSVVNGSETGVDVAVDTSGNIYALGQVPSATEDINYWISKYDTNGVVLWTRTPNSAGAGVNVNDVPKNIVVDGAGNSYVTGTAGTGNSHIFTVSYNMSGGLRFLQVKDFGTSADVGNEIDCDTSGNCYVAGESVLSGTRDASMISYGPTGSVRWSRTEAGPTSGPDVARGIVWRNGFVYIGGWFTTATDSDIIAGKFSAATGSKVWLKQMVLPYEDESRGSDVDVSADGGEVAVSGQWLRHNAQGVMLNSRAAGVAWFREVDGYQLVPTGDINNNSGTIGFENQDTIARAIKCASSTVISLGAGIDIANVILDGTVSGGTSYQVQASYFGSGQGQAGGTDGRAWDPNAMAGQRGTDVATEHLTGIGLGMGTIAVARDPNWNTPHDYDIALFRAGGGGATDGYFFYDHGNGNDYAGGLAFNPVDDVIICGSQTNASGNLDIVVAKITQRPSILFDEYALIKGKTLTVNAAGGVKRNDVGSTQATVVKDNTGPSNGTITLNSDGSFTYTPDAGFSGNDPLDYHLQKPYFGDIAYEGGQIGVLKFLVYPNIVSLNMPATATGGEYVVGQITMDGVEPTQAFGLAFIGGSATSNPPGIITFPYAWGGSGGNNQAQVTGKVQGVSSDKTVTVTVSRGGTTASDSLVVKPGGILSVTMNPNSVTGGNSTVGTVTLAVPASGATQIFLSSNSSAITVPTSVTVPDGGTSATFSVSTSAVTTTVTRQVIAKDKAENNQVISQATGNLILSPPSKLSGLTLNPTVVYGGTQNSTATITLDKPAAGGGVTVAVSDNSTAIGVPPSAVVNEGSTTGIFNVSTSPVSSVATRTVTAAYGGISKAANITLEPSPVLTNLTISPNVVTGGQSTNGTMTLSGTVAHGTITASVADNSGSISSPALVSVLQGTSSRVFALNTSAVGASATRQVTATIMSVTKTANLTLHPVPQLSAFSITPNSVKGGTSTTGKVTLSFPAGVGGNSVSITDNSTSIGVPSSVLVPHTMTQQTFAITTAAVSSTATRTVTATRAAVTKTANLTLTP